jgi:hypothetical protein
MTKEKETNSTPRPNRGIGGTKKAVFRNPFDTTIPEAIEQSFRAKGFSLRWVRVLEPTTKMPDHHRVNTFLAIGGSLVTADQIKSIDRGFLSGMVKYQYTEDFADELDARERGSSSGIRRGDLVLMQLPLEYTEEKRKYNEQLSRERLTSNQRTYKERTGGQYNSEVTTEQIPARSNKQEAASFYED